MLSARDVRTLPTLKHRKWSPASRSPRQPITLRQVTQLGERRAKDCVNRYLKNERIIVSFLTSLPEDDVDWDFPIHPEKAVGFAAD